jgi:hypothetical protein
VDEATETVRGEAVGGEAAATVPWALSEGGGVSVVRTRSVCGLDRAADACAQRF